MSNKRPLKAYVRYDGSGRAVSSSLIWRKNKPKVGNWKEVQGYECCNPGGGTLTFITNLEQENLFTTEFIATQFAWNCFNLLPEFTAANGGFSILEYTAFPINFSNWNDVISFLNTNFSTIGVFSYLGGTSVQLIANSNINQYIQCSNATFQLEFYVP